MPLEKKQISDTILFISEFLKSPKTMGAVYPSSKKLSICMAQQALKDDFVIELGAGTGKVTASLLGQGVSPKQLIVLERSPKFVCHLRKRFPEIMVIQGDAANLNTILRKYDKQNISTVVSSLPLRNMPISTVQTIMTQICQALNDQGRFIQFTYDLRSREIFFYKNFNRLFSKIIWFNLPPARVDVFTPI